MIFLKLINILYWFMQLVKLFYASQGTPSEELLSILTYFVLVVMIIILVISLLMAIGQCKLFRKAGKRGWEAFIPIYNIYTLCRVTGVNPRWIIIVFVLSIITTIMPSISILGTAASVYFFILLAISVARSFGKTDVYAIGIFFLGFIFYIILGFDNSKYLGPKPMKDVIFKDKLTANIDKKQ